MHHINSYPVIFFVPKMLSALLSAAYIQVHVRLDFFMKANLSIWTLIRLLQVPSDLDSYCLQEHKQMRKQTTKLLLVGKLYAI